MPNEPTHPPSRADLYEQGRPVSPPPPPRVWRDAPIPLHPEDIERFVVALRQAAAAVDRLAEQVKRMNDMNDSQKAFPV